MSEKAAILIVNGGKDPVQGKWIQLCIDKILELTTWQNYQIYVWNNNISDRTVTDFLNSIPLVHLVEADPAEKLDHVHAVPLQRLYELAKQENAKYIVTMDSDAHPLQKGWLTKIISSLDNEIVLAGVWRDELKKAISPYIHASCLCTTVDFIESHNLKLDFIAPNTETEIHDTLSILTETARDLNLKTFKLHRSNQNNFHRLMGGIYGNLIYHHGAGSRSAISFWDEEKRQKSIKINQKIGEIATNSLFRQYDNYINWLQGYHQSESFDEIMAQLQELNRTQNFLHVNDTSRSEEKNENLGIYSRAKNNIKKIIKFITSKKLLDRGLSK